MTQNLFNGYDTTYQVEQAAARIDAALYDVVDDAQRFDATVYAERPKRDIYDFIGTLTVRNDDSSTKVASCAARGNGRT